MPDTLKVEIIRTDALDAAGIEIPFPHQVAVPYREDVVPLVQLRAVGTVDGDK